MSIRAADREGTTERTEPTKTSHRQAETGRWCQVGPVTTSQVRLTRRRGDQIAATSGTLTETASAGFAGSGFGHRVPGDDAQRSNRHAATRPPPSIRRRHRHDESRNHDQETRVRVPRGNKSMPVLIGKGQISGREARCPACFPSGGCGLTATKQQDRRIRGFRRRRSRSG